MTMKRRCEGHEPDFEKGWKIVCEIDRWTVFARPGNGDWINVRVSFNGRRRGRANISLGWSTKELRFSKTKENEVLGDVMLDRIGKEVQTWLEAR